MTFRFAVLAGTMLLFPAFTQAELEKAKTTKEFFKDAYWKCLSTEILRAVPTKTSAQDFSVLTKQACTKELSDFFITLSK